MEASRDADTAVFLAMDRPLHVDMLGRHMNRPQTSPAARRWTRLALRVRVWFWVCLLLYMDEEENWDRAAAWLWENSRI